MARRVAAVWIVALLAVVACGDDTAPRTDASPDDVLSTLADALLAEASADPNAIQLTRADAECVASGVIEELGVDRLVEVGYDPLAESPPESLNARLDQEERLAVAARLGGCIDLVAEVESALVESGAPPSRAGCVARRYVESGLLTESLAATEFDADLDARINGFLAQAMMECG